MSSKLVAPQDLTGKVVILDTSSQLLYVGTLRSADEHFIELEDADVHDAAESPTSKEIYLIETRKYGVKKNRRFVFVRTGLVVSISRLDDVIEY